MSVAGILRWNSYLFNSEAIVPSRSCRALLSPPVPIVIKGYQPGSFRCAYCDFCITLRVDVVGCQHLSNWHAVKVLTVVTLDACAEAASNETAEAFMAIFRLARSDLTDDNSPSMETSVNRQVLPNCLPIVSTTRPGPPLKVARV